MVGAQGAKNNTYMAILINIITKHMSREIMFYKG